jgi:hypothetical protein
MRYSLLLLLAGALYVYSRSGETPAAERPVVTAPAAAESETVKLIIPLRGEPLIIDPYSLSHDWHDCDFSQPTGTDPCFVPDSCECVGQSLAGFSPALLAAVKAAPERR